MKYDVEVISTYSKFIEVDADTQENALEQALKQAERETWDGVLVSRIPSLPETKKKEYHCQYMEDDMLFAEYDCDTAVEAIEWFKESYNDHTWEYPNEDEIRCFLRGECVLVTLRGECFQEWKLSW